MLFHSFANGWSLVADMLPIAVFIYAHVFVAARRFLGLGALAAGLATLALWALSPALEAPLRPVLGASAAYAPGLVATFGVALAVPALGRGPAPRLLLAAGLAFAAALASRMLDQPLCGTWPIGTHFLWHCSTPSRSALPSWPPNGSAPRAVAPRLGPSPSGPAWADPPPFRDPSQGASS